MEGEGGGSADTRKGRPAAAGERDRARGGRRRRHGAHTLAYTRSHSTPGRSPPEGPRRGRGERCNLLATVGNCKGARRPRPLAQRAGAPAGPAPTAPASPQLQASPPHRASAASPSPPEEKRKKVRQRGADLAWEGKRVSLVSLLPVLLPAPAQLRALEPLRSGTRPVGFAARAPKGDRQPAEPHGWSAPAKRRVARSVSH